MAGHSTGILLESGTNELEIIEIFIDEEGYRGFYGVNVAKILEIINLPEKIVAPPNAAHFVKGVFNHRGRVIVLIDLASWLGRNRIETERPAVLITEFNQVVTSFLVSGVTRIHRTSWSNIKPLDEYTQGFSNVLTGVVLLENRTVFMLDLEKAIADIDPRLAMPGIGKASQGSIVTKDKDTVETEKTSVSRRWNVLHADDSGMIRKGTKAVLEESGEYTVTSVVDGNAAWDYLLNIKMTARDQNLPITDFLNIVLSDIEMPGMDGYSLCQKIKTDPELKKLPVVLFSSLITDKLIHKGESVKADRQLAKPSPGELFATVKELIEK